MPHHLIKHLVKNKARAGLKATKEVAETVVKTAPKPKATPKPPKPPKAPRATTPKPPPKPKPVQAEPVSPQQAAIDLGQERIEANKQRKRNGQRPLTQDEWDIKQPARIDKVRNQLEEANLAIEELEVANPDVSKKELSLKSKEYKAAKKKKKVKEAEVSSEESNVLVPGPGRQHAYPPDKPRAKELKVADLKRRGTIENLELHHKLPKGISAGFLNRARDLVNKGLAPRSFIEKLGMMAKKVGMEAGDIEQNMLPMSKAPHNTFHTEMRNQTSSSFNKERLEIGKTELKSKLSKVKSMEELEALWTEFLEGDGKYLYQTSEVWEPLDELLKTISPKFTGRAKLSTNV